MPLKPVKIEAYQFRWEQRLYVSDSVRSRAEIIALCGMTLELNRKLVNRCMLYSRRGSDDYLRHMHSKHVGC
jgi:hypothetical protein